MSDTEFIAYLIAHTLGLSFVVGVFGGLGQLATGGNLLSTPAQTHASRVAHDAVLPAFRDSKHRTVLAVQGARAALLLVVALYVIVFSLGG